MLIEGIMNGLFTALTAMTSFINLPNLPTEIATYLAEFTAYLTAGAAILNNYVPMNYILGLLTITIGVDVAVHGYKFILWVLKKIPILNIK